MTNIYEEAYKEAERKIKKLSEDFKKDLDKIIKECTKNKPQIGEECELVGIEKQVWESTINRSMVLEAENAQLKELLKEFAETNQSLRKQLDREKEKNKIDYYSGSPMDFLDECERDRKKNKIYKNLINNIREELIISDLRKTGEGNKFIVNLLAKINQALGEDE